MTRTLRATNDNAVRPPQSGPPPATKWIDITPAVATKYLETMPTDPAEVFNRRLSEAVVSTYARDMAAGRWVFNPIPIMLDTQGVVRDGQHRLHAIVRSGITVKCLVVTGVTPEAQSVVDGGRRRSVNDQLRLIQTPNATIVGAVTICVLMWRNGSLTNSHWKPSRMEVLDFVEKERYLLQTAALEAQALRAQLPAALVSAFGSMWFKLSAIDAEACESFFTQLRTGVDLTLDHPINTLRNSLIRADRVVTRRRGREDRNAQLAQAIITWNKWRRGDTMRSIRIPNPLSSLNFPVILEEQATKDKVED